MKMSFLNLPGQLRLHTYPNNRLALALHNIKTGGVIVKCTVNVPDEPLTGNEIIIKNYNENTGIYFALLAEGVISPVKREIVIGFERGFVVDLLKNPETGHRMQAPTTSDSVK